MLVAAAAVVVVMSIKAIVIPTSVRSIVTRAATTAVEVVVVKSRDYSGVLQDAIFFLPSLDLFFPCFSEHGFTSTSMEPSMLLPVFRGASSVF